MVLLNGKEIKEESLICFFVERINKRLEEYEHKHNIKISDKEKDFIRASTLNGLMSSYVGKEII